MAATSVSDQNIGGIHLVQADTEIGGFSLSAGQLLISLQSNDTTVGDTPTIDVKRQDIFVLDVTVTEPGGGPTAATATRFFEGLDESLNNNNESIWGIGFQGNGAPTVTAATLNVDENSANATVVGSVSASDPETDPMNYAITAGNTDGAFTIDAITGQITVANSAVLDFETTPVFTLTVAAIDDKGAYGTATITINLNDLNEAPVNNVPGAQSTNEDTALVFNDANLNKISISDVDAGTDQVEVTLSVNDGILTLSGTTGLTFVTGSNGSATMTISGTLLNINTALDGLTFMPDLNFNGSDSLQITTHDDATLLGYYSFDDAGNPGADDGAGTPDDGTVNGATSVNDATRGNVLSFDGDDSVQISGHFGDPANITLSAWVDLTAADTNGADVISLGDSVILRYADWSGGSVRGAYYDGATWQELSFSNNLVGAGWHHVAYSVDDTSNLHTLYLDGVAVDSGAMTGSIDYTLGADTFIGAHGDGDPLWDVIGQVDDARIYDRALGAAEIAGIMNSVSGKDSDSVAITVNPVNDAPVAYADEVHVDEGGTVTALDNIFLASANIASGVTNAAAVTSADLDGDGDLDIVAAIEGTFTGQIVWYEYIGAGNFTSHAVSAATLGNPVDVFTADLDGDGDADVLSASRGGGQIHWFENDGAGNFTTHLITSSESNYLTVSAVDLDGDFDIDVISGDSVSGKVEWHINDGSGNFTADQLIANTATNVFSVDYADMDGDGDQDVLSAQFDADTLTWYENLGGGSFSTHDISVTLNGAIDVSAGDIDGDGDADVLSAAYYDGKITWWENDGSGNLTAHDISATGAWSVEANDIDGDGDLDLLAAQDTADPLHWYENDGSGTFAEHIVAGATSGAGPATALDVDNDGDKDIVTADYSNDSIDWHENVVTNSIVLTNDVDTRRRCLDCHAGKRAEPRRQFQPEPRRDLQLHPRRFGELY